MSLLLTLTCFKIRALIKPINFEIYNYIDLKLVNVDFYRGIEIKTSDAEKNILQPGEYIFSSETYNKIQKFTQNKQILIIDYNGVVGGYAEGNIINPQALDALNLLKKFQYELVLWSLSDRSTINYLKKNNLLHFFPLAIYRDNYAVNPNNLSYEEYLEVEKHLKSIKWLTEVEKTTIEENLITNEVYYNKFLQIPLLFKEAGIIDDDAQGQERISRFFQDSTQRYPIIPTVSFNPIKEQLFDLNFDNKYYFGPEMVLSIIEKYPPVISFQKENIKLQIEQILKSKKYKNLKKNRD